MDGYIRKMNACTYITYFNIVLISLFAISGGSFTSVYKLSKLSRIECHLVRFFKSYFQKLDWRSRDDETLAKISRLFEQISPKTVVPCTDQTYPENPINAYKLIKRFVNDWKGINDILTANDIDDTDEFDEIQIKYQDIVLHPVLLKWPEEADLRKCASALIRLRYFYRLDLHNLFRGQIFDSQEEALTSMDLFFIARQAEYDHLISEEILWLETLLEREKRDPNFDTLMISKTARALASAYFKMDMPLKSVEVLNNSLHLDDKKIEKDFEYYNEKAKGTCSAKDKYISTIRDNMTEAYAALCRSNQKTAQEVMKLKCFLRGTRIPYYRSKEEVVNNSPRISIFHDVISKREAELLRNLGKINLAVSTVLGQQNQNGRDIDFKTRISETSWVSDENPTIIALSRRISLITGLNTTLQESLSNAEEFQVLNYGIGGMYHPHYDALSYPLWGPPYIQDHVSLVGSGDRIATWMFYLSSVTAGGATVFPRLRTRIPVVEGSAAFWYNLKPNGVMDKRTEHAGCPVLLGSKWVSNKWIRETGQVFRYLCGKTEDAEAVDPV